MISSTPRSQRRNLLTVLFALLFLLTALSPQRLAAQGYGSIVGTVTDPTGAIVASATVTATQTDTGRQTVVTTGAGWGIRVPDTASDELFRRGGVDGFPET